MTLADDIRKATEGYEPRCQFRYDAGYGCERSERLHGGPPERWGVGVTFVPQFFHDFQRDPALDKSPEALLVRALRVVQAAEVAINGLLSTGWLMDSLTSEEGWSGEPNRHQWLYDAIHATDAALRGDR